MLICEVVLGKSKETQDFNQLVGEISPTAEFNSVKGVGQRGPDFDNPIYLPSGRMLPSLPVKDYGYQSGARRMGGGLSYNEYIVYDETQIRIRYLIQLK